MYVCMFIYIYIYVCVCVCVSTIVSHTFIYLYHISFDKACSFEVLIVLVLLIALHLTNPILLGFTVFLLTVVRAREIQGKMLILSKTSTSSAADSPKKGRIRAIQKVCLFHMKILWS